MKIPAEAKEIMVEKQLEKAKRTVAEWDMCIEHQVWGTLANRMYYAVFYAVTALLTHNDYQPGTHQGAQILLNGKFVQPGIISPSEAKLFSQLQSLRELGDCDYITQVSWEELKPLIPKAKAFIAHIETLLTENNIIAHN